MYSVHLGKNSQTGRKAAIKIIKPEIIDNVDMAEIEREIDVLKSMNHKNITKLLDYGYVDLTTGGKSVEVYHIALEVAKGGELFDFISVTGHFTEDESRYFFHHLVAGMEYLHNQGISHRDLKPENILLDKHFNLVIADFGYASEKSNNVTVVGTKDYMAPEILAEEPYNGKVADIFGMGLILFMMRAQSRAFLEASRSDSYYKSMTQNKPYKFWKAHEDMKECQGFFSEEFIDLVSSLMAFDPKQRPTISEIKAHPWFNQEIPSKDVIEQLFAQRKEILDEELREQAEQDPASHSFNIKIFEGKNVHRGILDDEEADSSEVKRDIMDYDADFKRYTEFFSTTKLEELWQMLATYVDKVSSEYTFAADEYSTTAKVVTVDGKYLNF
jgi:serine/threonine protein kinase